MQVQHTRIPRVCERCGVTFAVKPHVIKDGGGKFCSNACYRAARAERVESRPCLTCGRVFRPKATQVRDGRGNFCSQPCVRRAKQPLAERLLSRVKETASGCWEWQGYTRQDGYARVTIRPTPTTQETHLAHRLAYETWVGPIPEGLVIDHVCRNRACINPSHLEVVTQATNNQRGMAPSFQAQREQRCKRGHPYTPEHSYFGSDGRRRSCRTCETANQRRRRAEIHAR